MKKTVRAGYAMLPLLAAVLVAMLCRQGVGTTDDTPAYYLAAEKLSVQTLPYHFPPLYPVLLGLATRVTGGLSSAAFWLNTVGFAAAMAILLAGLRRAAGIEDGEALLVGGVVLFSYSALFNYAYAMSEGLFFPLALIVIFVFVAYARHGGGTCLLLTAGLVAGVSAWVRYVGVVFVPFGLAVLAWVHRSRFRTFLRGAMLYLIVTIIPVLLLFMFNVLRGGTATNRSLVVNAVSPLQQAQLITVLVECFLPYRAAVLFGARSLGVLAVLVLLVCVYVTWAARKRVGGALVVVWLFCGCYLAVVLLAVVFSDAMVPLDHRILGPFGLALTVGVTTSCAIGFRHGRGGSRAVCLLVLVVFCITNFVRGARFVAISWRDGNGYSHASWRRSALLDFVVKEQDRFGFYSNAPAAPYLVRGAPIVQWIPWKKNPHSLAVNPQYADEMSQLADEVRSCRAVVVLFRIKHWREQDYPDYLNTPADILALDGLCVLRDFWDGLVIGACGDACPDLLAALPGP